MAERKPEKKMEMLSIGDRFKLAKALIKNKSLEGLEYCATFILAKYDQDIAKLKCDCKNFGIGNAITLKLIGLFV